MDSKKKNFKKEVKKIQSDSEPTSIKNNLKNTQEVITSITTEAAWLKWLFIGVAASILVSMAILSQYAGISGDEEKHHNHAVKVYNWFATAGEDTSALNDPKLKLNYYSQSFDFVCYVLVKTFKIEKVYEFRHFLTSIIGFLTILFTGLLVRFITRKYEPAIIAMVIMFLTPAFLGHSLNNPLDVPFAFAYAFSLLYLFKFLDSLPKFSIKYAALFSVGVAMAIGIRIGGLILIPYAGLFALIYILFNKWPYTIGSKENLAVINKGVIYLMGISVVAYFLGMIFWPYALVSPLVNPFDALKMMSNIDVSLKVMYEGTIVWSNELPWYYITKNILLTVPAVVLIGFFLTMILLPGIKKQVRPMWLFFLTFAVVFPIIYIILKKSNVYGSWRHLTFIYPSMVALSSVGIYYVITLFNNKIYKYIMLGVFVASLYSPVKHIIKNKEIIYIYYNEFTGGVDKMNGIYETDYYFNSLKHGSEWLLQNEISKITPEAGKKIRVGANAGIPYYFRNDTAKVRTVYMRYYDRGEFDWDYAVIFCNYLSPYQLQKGIWPPKGTIHTINVDNVPVCAILKRLDKSDYYGFLQKEKGNLDSAAVLLEKALAIDPNNESAISNLGEVYLQTGRVDECIALMQHCNSNIYPDNERILELMGISYFSKGEADNAAGCFGRIIKTNYKYVSAYYWIARTYIMQNAPDLALSYLQKAIEVSSGYGPAYELIGQILQQQGRTQEAQQYFQMANQLR